MKPAPRSHSTALRPKVFIAGGGGIGRALALMLRNEPSVMAEVVIGDVSPAAAQAAAEFSAAGAPRVAAPRAVPMPAEGSDGALEAELEAADVLVDCLPGSEAPRLARLARRHGCHYLNLTEYVAETRQVLEIAQGAETCFALQCGLAPGFVNILAHGLFQEACQTWGVQKLERLRMRVGALTDHAVGPHFYGFTWSTVGVATEYVHPGQALRGGRLVELPPLSERQALLLDGLPLEEAVTSGGAADLPQALAGYVQELDYKTLRYPGHFAWVEGLLSRAPAGVDRARWLLEQMEAAVPHCEEDLIAIYADVEGRDASGRLRALRHGMFCTPIEIEGQRLSAIQATTAAGVAEVLRLILKRTLRGPLLQSQIPPADYLDGPFIQWAFGAED
jgi:saccharopine dehydrogenase-like NADP-dependent oxidoreductase